MKKPRNTTPRITRRLAEARHALITRKNDTAFLELTKKETEGKA